MTYSSVTTWLEMIGVYLLAPGLFFLAIALLLMILGVLWAPFGALVVAWLLRSRAGGFQKGLAAGASSSIRMFIPWLYVYFVANGSMEAKTLLRPTYYTLFSLAVLGPFLAFTMLLVFFVTDIVIAFSFDALSLVGLSNPSPDLGAALISILVGGRLYWMLIKDLRHTWQSVALPWQLDVDGAISSYTLPADLGALARKVMIWSIVVTWFYIGIFILNLVVVSPIATLPRVLDVLAEATLGI